MIKKTLQNIFKKALYSIFIKFYGKIENTIENNSEKRIKIESINIENIVKYKIYKVTSGKLYTNRVQDTAILLDNKIIEGPSFQLRHKPNGKIFNSNISENIVFKTGTPRILKELKGTVLSLLTGGGGNNNYWHWLYDVLPRFYLAGKTVELNQIDYFLLPSIKKKYQKETLDSLKIEKNKRLSSEKYRHIKANQLIITDHPYVITGDSTKDITNIPTWIINWLKKTFIIKKNINGKDITKKFYIDRKDKNTNYSSERSIINENEVKVFLEKRGFKNIKLHELNFQDQVDLFYNAECIVGLHGAGFANISFCKPNTQIIELRSFNAGLMYENLAKKNNLNYCPIITDEEQLKDYKHPNQQGGIYIPIENLSKILN